MRGLTFGKFGRMGAAGRHAASAWSPLSLFAAGEQGAWYDPSDLTTMFQDSGGTTPVTAVEQPVGKILDESGRGNHATQATAPSRAKLRNLYNLLTYTETGQGWATDSMTLVSGRAGVSGQTAQSFALTNGTTNYPRAGVNVASGVAVVCRAWIWVPTGTITVRPAAFYNSAWQLLGSGNLAVTSTPQLFEWTYTPSTATSFGSAFALQCAFSGGSSEVQISGATLAYANDASLPYQRVAAATDYDSDASTFPLASSFDGADDHWTAAAGGGGTTGGTWVVGVRLNALGAARTIWSDAGTNTGYRLRINASNQVVFEAGNGSAYTSATVSTPLELGQRAVITAWHDGTTLNVQVGNGTTATASMGTVTAGTAGFTIGRANGGTTEPLNGHLYDVIYVRNEAKTADISAARAYVAALMGVTL